MPSPFVGLGYINMENKHGHIQYSLDCPPGSVLCLSISFVSLFLLPNFSNPHAPILECTNPIKARFREILPQCVAVTEFLLGFSPLWKPKFRTFSGQGKISTLKVSSSLPMPAHQFLFPGTRSHLLFNLSFLYVPYIQSFQSCF